MAESRRNFLRRAAGGLSLSARPLIGLRGDAQAGADRAAALRAPRGGEAVLVCGGDWFLMRRLSTAPAPETQAVFDVFRRAHAGFANLENGLSTVGAGELGGFRQGAPLRGDPSLVSELEWGGVRTVSLANNHTGNYGPDALLQTIATLDKAGVGHAGAGANLDQAVAPAFVRAGGLTVAFLSIYTLLHRFGASDQASPTAPGVAVCRAYDVVVHPQMGFDPSNFDKSPYLVDLEQPHSQTIMAASREDVDRLKAAVKQAATRADFTLMSAHIHWGRHTKHDLPPSLRAFAQEMIDAGADMFVGHGPHAIRAIEMYRGKPIVHSMGNFVLQGPTSSVPVPEVAPPGREGLVIRAAVTARAMRSLEILPIVIDAKGDPRFPSASQCARTLGKLAGLSAPFGVEFETKGWFGVVPIG